ncbi:hypothetical protein Lfu02_77360 [Longispora fulva]|uniref:Uncharacterized protein (TIGR02246 family) n=1 Tax=Longispora fulva TaxID=619741 RepID=A0A8J7GH69_9ACTN|nr:SgcJ/EcaC family oxidoreductase [Longispora fulva]MBG6136148.1 uncharacterized protein (TIGR02246 family) [Longispora fulva]GIG63364.1 hypothetical protein Lfu02_77360 [Longispora fulva]
MNIQTDTATIHALLDQLLDAWKRADGTAYGALFTDDASYVTILGTHYRGAREIGAAHQVLFDTWLKGTQLSCEVLDLRFLGADAATVVTRGDTYKGTPGKPGKIQTYALVRGADGAWKFAAFHNTQRKALMEAVSFKFQPATRPAAQLI